MTQIQADGEDQGHPRIASWPLGASECGDGCTRFRRGLNFRLRDRCANQLSLARESKGTGKVVVTDEIDERPPSADMIFISEHPPT